MTASAIIEAVVQVGVEQTRYLRCGRGPRYFVVLADEPAERMRLIHEHAAAGCVIAPIPVGSATVPVSLVGAPAGNGPSSDLAPVTDAASVEGWLRGVLEGLGLERPTVILATGLAPLLGELLAACGDRIDLVVSPARGQDR